ncbi:hypothetical protein ABZ896_06830 [Streptomyces sp. NPDC047072]|uniref:hypothetical protein n=1 Tax=Streptomyces sp. NPDC047072 TaxID=3154809 RepID=UPI0033F310AC
MKTRSTTRNALRFVGVTAAALTAALATALPADAAGGVDRTDCGNRTDILRLETNTGNLCFVNRGDQDVQIYGVTAIWPGDYTVTVAYQATINGDVRYLDRDPRDGWESPMHKVTHIWIK